MGIDIFESIITSFLKGYLKLSETLQGYRKDSVEVYSDFLDYDNVFNCVDQLKSVLGVDVSALVRVVFSYAFYLLILKFVWKAFDTYLLGTNGDDDNDPSVMIISFIKAMFISLSFGLLFDYLVNIASEITAAIVKAVKVKNALSLTNIISAYISNTITGFLLMILFIYAILAIVINIKFLTNGIQLVILRVGISFATVGVLDADGGVFKPYAKKFFQICFTVVIQVICYKLSLVAMAEFHVMYGLAFMGMALSAPSFLSEFIMVNQGGGNKLQQALYSMNILRSFKRTKA